MNRMFERASINVPGARPQPAFVIHCSKCDASEKISMATHKGGTPPPEALASKFRNLGWSLSTRDGGDICPKCQERKKSTTQQESNVVEMKVKAEPPREMSKEDQRIIFAEINDVYIDEKTGYSAGWNDKKVAEKLGVPLAWVKGVREAHFGKEGQAEELSKILASARDLQKKTFDEIEKARMFVDRAAEDYIKAMTAWKTAEAYFRSLGTTIEAIEKAVIK